MTASTSDGKRELGKGELSLVDNQVDTTTGSIKLKAKFANEEKTLWPGLSVSTRLLITTEKTSSLFPTPPSKEGRESCSLTSSAQTKRSRRRDLEVGEIQDGQAVIKSGDKGR